MSASNAMHAGAGVLFKPAHFDALMANLKQVDLIEIHAENYFGAGGLLHAALRALRAQRPISIHGVGLSLGGLQRPDGNHLQRLAQLCERYQPALVSEHLAWSSYAGQYLSDLLPIPYTEASLRRVSAHVSEVQERLNQRILIENPARYFRFDRGDMNETEFLEQLCARTGCLILLDLNNLVVSQYNNNESDQDFLNEQFLSHVGAIHLAGHARRTLATSEVLIDDHGSKVAETVWTLYDTVVRRAGPLPTIIEWDRNVPTFAQLAAEVARARSLQTEASALQHGDTP